MLSSLAIVAILPTLNVNAAAKKGWIKDGDDWSYIKGDGTYQKGWMEDGVGIWYYFDNDGVMIRDTTKTINNLKCKFADDGEWVNTSNNVIKSGKTYKIINAVSGKALDVYAAGASDYTNVDIYTDNNTNAQRWKIYKCPDGAYKIINIGNQKALDVYAAQTADYTNVDVFYDNGTKAQRWNISQNSDGTYQIINVGSAKALDVYAAGTADYTNVNIYTPNGTNAQKWYIVEV